MPIKCQSIANPTPIKCQSIANPMPIHCQSNVSQSSRSFANPISVPRQICQSNANRCQSISNPLSIRCQSVPIHCQSIANPLSIRCQSITNPISLNYRSPDLMSILDQSANPPPIHEAHANLPIPCQSNANLSIFDRFLNLASIQYQSLLNLPIYYQSVNPTPILANLQPIHTDISHRADGTSTIGDLPKCLGTPSFTAHSRYANPSPNPIHCQCSVNSLPIQCQSANPLPIR